MRPCTANNLIISALTAWCLTWGAGQCQAQGPQGDVPGLLPVYNASGEPYGEVFSGYLTASVFDALSKQGWNCLLLNPGGLYSPFNETAAIDHARAAGVGWVIALSLKPAHREPPADEKPEIIVEGRVLSVSAASGERPVTARHEVKRKDLNGGFDVGHYHPYKNNPWATDGWYWPYDSSRRLSKQPLGKAVLKMAADLQSVLSDAFRAMGMRPTAITEAPGTCDVVFRVEDSNRKWSSKSYSVVVNGRDESAGVRSGVLNLQTQSGLLVIEVQLRDTPFGLPIQSVYRVNTSTPCQGGSRAVTLTIGPSGQGLLVSR